MEFLSIAKLVVLTFGFIFLLWITNLFLDNTILQFVIDMALLIIFLFLESFWANVTRYPTTEKDSN